MADSRTKRPKLAINQQSITKAQQLLDLLRKILPQDARGRAVIVNRQWIFPESQQLALMRDQALDSDITRHCRIQETKSNG